MPNLYSTSFHSDSRLIMFDELQYICSMADFLRGSFLGSLFLKRVAHSLHKYLTGHLLLEDLRITDQRPQIIVEC